MFWYTYDVNKKYIYGYKYDIGSVKFKYLKCSSMRAIFNFPKMYHVS